MSLAKSGSGLISVKPIGVFSRLFAVYLLGFLATYAPTLSAKQPDGTLSVTVDNNISSDRNDYSAEEYYQRGHDALSANDKAMALEAFVHSCSKDHAKSCYNVGILAETIDPGLADRPEEVDGLVKTYARACSLGFQRGCIAQAQIYRSPRYGRQDLTRALNLLSTACDADEVTGCEDLAEIYYTGEGANPDLARAADLFKKGCDADSRALSCFNYGLMREKGQGVPKDAAIALNYYRLGCRKGADQACINLGFRYADQNEAIIAKKLFRQSCDRAALEACANLGELLRNTDLDHPDNAAAAEVFKKACDKGNGKSCRSLGQMAQDGSKAAGTKSGAILYFERGCELQHAQSCYNAGFTYWIGYHVRKSPKRALNWYAKGCYLKSASSCAGASLAVLAFKKGDPRGSEAIARKWFDAAYALDPDSELVQSLKVWYDRDAQKAGELPPVPKIGERPSQ